MYQKYLQIGEPADYHNKITRGISHINEFREGVALMDGE